MALTLQRSLVNATSRFSSINRCRRMTVVAQADHINRTIKKDVDKVSLPGGCRPALQLFAYFPERL
jgi:hypothetical protein